MLNLLAVAERKHGFAGQLERFRKEFDVIPLQKKEALKKEWKVLCEHVPLPYYDDI
jgi:hypothetical protein